MASCEKVRPLLSHVTEGELSPDEAMLVARHLGDCTACKIVLARERRLAVMLEHEMVDLPVGDDFVESVMANLPQGPPPRRARLRRRGLKLACLALLLGSGALPAAGNLGIHPAWVGPIATPAPGLDAMPGVVESLSGLVRLAGVAVDAATRAPAVIVPVTGAVVTALSLLAFAAAGIGACSTLLAVATRFVRGAR